MAISEFEKQRQANIERNKRLLDQLNIEALSEAVRVKTDDKPTSGSKRKKVKTEKTTQLPVRRSGRIAGVKIEEGDGIMHNEIAENKKMMQMEQLEKLKNTRINGDISLMDLVLDKKPSIKLEDSDEDPEKILEKFQSFMRGATNFSVGDYYDEMVKRDTKSSKNVQKLREEFNEMCLYEHFDPKELNLTKSRMTYVTFHPSAEKKLILAGDNDGNMGVWDADNTDEVDITQFRMHRKPISKLEFDLNDTTKVYTCSYDASVRCIDLNTMKSTQFFVNDFDVGITDINYSGDHEIYYTTMRGQFGRLDMRANDHSRKQTFRLSNKKIGGFAINPNNKNQIATASLDRTMKIYDLKTAAYCDWNEWDDNLETLHTVGTYDSRLSVSLVDWNHSNDLVCNGYDDTLNIFNLGADATKWEPRFSLPETELKPSHKIKHNCQTGRWVSILKTRWHKFPTDATEKFVVGNMKKYFDVYDRDGNQLAHLGHPLMTNVPAVANFHHTQNWLVGGGASGKAYLFT